MEAEPGNAREEVFPEVVHRTHQQGSVAAFQGGADEGSSRVALQLDRGAPAQKHSSRTIQGFGEGLHEMKGEIKN